jgi:hypothetical protein
MNLTSIKAKIAAGVLPATNGIAVHRVRYTAGVCAGCEETVPSDDVGGVQFDARSGGHLLHVDCYVMWSEACAD